MAFADVIILGPAQFFVADPDECDFEMNSDNDSCYFQSSSTDCYLYAEVLIAHRSKIMRVDVFYYDNDS